MRPAEAKAIRLRQICRLKPRISILRSSREDSKLDEYSLDEDNASFKLVNRESRTSNCVDKLDAKAFDSLQSLFTSEKFSFSSVQASRNPRSGELEGVEVLIDAADGCALRDDDSPGDSQEGDENHSTSTNAVTFMLDQMLPLSCFLLAHRYTRPTSRRNRSSSPS